MGIKMQEMKVMKKRQSLKRGLCMVLALIMVLGAIPMHIASAAQTMPLLDQML